MTINFEGFKTRFATCLYPAGKLTETNKRIFIMRCECGNLFETPRPNLRKGATVSCGCRNKRGYRLPKPGDVFGDLTYVRETAEIGVHGHKVYLFKCVCGNDKTSELNSVLSGGLKSCGCLSARNGISALTEKYKGNKYNMLTFVKHSGKWAGPAKGKNPIATWLCDCGKETDIRFGDVKSGKTTCCGCKTGRDGGEFKLGGKWNKLTLVELLGQRLGGNYGLFKCECGDTTKGKISNVVAGLKKSCGCDMSSVLRAKRGFTLDESAFDELTDESAYWLGFLMADGNVSKNTICINLKTSDIGHLEKFRKFVGGNQKISLASDPRVVRYAFGSIRMTKKLAEWGVYPAKSYTAKPHELLLSNSNFWRGVIDGDGSVTEDHTAIMLCGTKAMCEGLLEFAKTFCRTAATVRQEKPNLWVVRIGVGRKYNLPLLKVLYENTSVYLDRKYEAAIKIINKVEM